MPTIKERPAYWFIEVQMETYRRPQPANPYEEPDEDEEPEIRVCDALLSIYDIQMVTDVYKDNRIAVMLTDSSIVSVIGSVEEFKEKLRAVK